MATRIPAVAGRFYPGSAEECRSDIESFLSGPGDGPARPVGRVIGGIVPHAGWMFSGQVAAYVIRALATDTSIETFVVFGAVHSLFSRAAGSIYATGSWRTPLGNIDIDADLARAVVEGSPMIAADPAPHEQEHSIEVQVPFIQHLSPSASLLPVLVPPTASAPQVGRLVADRAQAVGRKVVFVGSTDLTHYGPRYQFTPMGLGAKALKWAKEVNDRRLLDLVLTGRADDVVGEAVEHRNACGAGAVAAAIAASWASGTDQATVLQHVTSNEVARHIYGEMADAVGYAGVLFTASA